MKKLVNIYSPMSPLTMIGSMRIMTDLIKAHKGDTDIGVVEFESNSVSHPDLEDTIDQVRVLDRLRYKYGCIEYEVEKLWDGTKTIDDIRDGLLKVNDDFGGGMDISKERLYEILRKEMSAVKYRIKILSKFDEIVRRLDNEPAFTLEFNNRIVYLNGVRLRKVTGLSILDNILAKSFENDGKGSIEMRKQEDLNSRPIQAYLNDLKINKPVWSLFFSELTDNSVKFRSKVSYAELDLTEDEFYELYRELSRIDKNQEN